MNIDSCENCGKIFQPTGGGIRNILCANCFLDCEAAYDKVTMHFAKKGAANFEELVKQLNVPKVFIELFEKERRYEPLMRNFCRHCHIALPKKDRDMCEKCLGKVNQIINWKKSASTS